MVTTDNSKVNENLLIENEKLKSINAEMLEMLKELVLLNDLGHQIGQFEKANQLILKATTL